MPGQDIGSEKPLKEFRITCRIFFEDAILGKSFISNLDQNYICEKMHHVIPSSFQHYSGPKSRPRVLEYELGWSGVVVSCSG